ncbi:MAG: hypothetical protein J6E43_06305, partial [Prevotella sp.]|nr:hypothetical protein [Prevotella sp.]
AISAVKIIMQATGETTMSEMTRDSSTAFTSKAKQLIKSLTGNAAEESSSGSSASDNSGSDNSSSSSSSDNTSSGGSDDDEGAGDQ